MLCYPMGGNDVPEVVGGGYSDHVLLAPPFIATHENIDSIVDALGLALDDVFGNHTRNPTLLVMSTSFLADCL